MPADEFRASFLPQLLLAAREKPGGQQQKRARTFAILEYELDGLGSGREVFHSGGCGTTTTTARQHQPFSALRVGSWTARGHLRHKDTEYLALTKIDYLLTMRRERTIEQAAAASHKTVSTKNDTSKSPYSHAPDYDATGVVKLAVTRTPCLSCLQVIKKFRRKFPNVTLLVGFEELEKRF